MCTVIQCIVYIVLQCIYICNKMEWTDHWQWQQHLPKKRKCNKTEWRSVKRSLFVCHMAFLDFMHCESTELPGHEYRTDGQTRYLFVILFVKTYFRLPIFTKLTTAGTFFRAEFFDNLFAQINKCGGENLRQETLKMSSPTRLAVLATVLRRESYDSTRMYMCRCRLGSSLGNAKNRRHNKCINKWQY